MSEITGKGRRINSKSIKGKHIKHSPNTQPKSVIEKETTFLVKSSTPFVSAFKKILKILNKFNKSILPNKKYQNGEYKKVKYISIKGMGKSIEKTLSLGLKFQDELNYKIDVLTGSVEVLDEFRIKENSDSEEDDEEEYIYKKRMVSYVEIRVWIRRE